MVSKVSEPKLYPGYQTGDLTVVGYVGYQVPPNAASPIKQHLYRTRCTCGGERLARQSYLISTHIWPKHCEACSRKRSYEKDAARVKKKQEAEKKYLQSERRLTPEQELMKLWKAPKSVMKEGNR